MNISGPGSAMAVAVSVAIYSSAFASEISDSFRVILLFMAVVLLIGTYKIEQLHVEKEKNTNELPPTVQDEKEENGEVKLIQQQNFIFAILIVIISMSLSFFGNLLANYTYADLLLKYSFDLGYSIVSIILLGFILILSCLVYKIGFSKTKKLMDESEKRGKQDTDES